ncbi:hypothetical protein Cgig2_009775 [Carnegiea gigantea]|uniref:Reverse transcriptase domain-containing protein n=1 Tax=Carnegiea gigantea TaxID=171969 RepID=A0A9Q1Q3P4_9CARY|nr:hypothetical protein Cgig2_009775 [Carnegiea gigantea]
MDQFCLLSNRYDCAPFSNLDTKEALLSIPTIKSLGPDRHISSFFRDSSQIIGPLIYAAIHEFFEIRSMPEYVGTTVLLILPKLLNPMIMIYGRLKDILPHLISQSQGVFIQGRKLLFNILICQEIARHYLRKNISHRCLMKIDMKKGFDSIY